MLLSAGRERTIMLGVLGIQASTCYCIVALQLCCAYGVLAVLCHLTHMQGVSENIMLGQLCPLGTGAFDLLLNEEELAAAVDLLGMEDGEGGMGYGEYGWGDGGMTPGRTPGHMTPSRTPYMTPNRCAGCALSGSSSSRYASSHSINTALRGLWLTE